MDEDILDILIRDCRKNVVAINQQDVHLLRQGLVKLSDHIVMVTSLTQQGADIEADVQNALLSLLQNLELLRMLVENSITSNETAENAELSTIQLDPGFIIELRAQGLPWSKIANIHGVSRQAMYDYRVKNNIVEPNSSISDEQLREIIIENVNQFPNAGVKFMCGAIRHAGFRVSKKRVWLCLREVDPIGVATRKRKCISRRAYKVKGANYLWHMDSTHKLVMFRFVIHGCIDGYSRRIIYLNVANNNKASTPLTYFKRGVLECGLPKRVRGDKGCENVQVKRFMIHNSSLQQPFIHGASVHNTRIERLWNDVNTQVTRVYKAIFLDLEDQGKLDENNELQLFLLSYVFLPRIQRSLDRLQDNWNNHCMRTMNNRTPLQVWTVNMMQQGPQNFIDTFEENNETSDSDGEMTQENGVIVPTFPPDMLNNILEECERLVPDPLSNDDSDGVDHYNSLLIHFNP